MKRQVLSVNVGTVRPWLIDGRSVASAVDKRPVVGPVDVGSLGLAGDEQADPSVHGGLGKAVYAYPIEHYAFWQTVRAQAGVAAWGEALQHGGLGENLTLSGLLEGDAWVGDVLRFPECELGIHEPRSPCYKLNAALGFAHAARLMKQSGWCGFHLSVRQSGRIEAGQSYEVIAGPREVNIRELFQARGSRV